MIRLERKGIDIQLITLITLITPRIRVKNKLGREMFIYYLSFIIYYLFFIMNLKMENLKMGTEMEMLEISKKDKV